MKFNSVNYIDNKTTITASNLNDIQKAIQKLGYLKDSYSRVYCWGNSLTQGIGGNAAGWHLISYPAVLSERIDTVNLGILSDDIPTIMARMGSDPALLPAVTIPASSSESVVVGSASSGFTTKSGRTAKLLKYGDSGINPCYINDTPCILFRDYDATDIDNQSLRLRRLEDGEAITISAKTPLVTYAAKHYRDNGLHIFWMGANGGYGDDAAHNNLAFSDYVTQLQKCVNYVFPQDYLIVYSRERKGYATDENAEIATLKAQFGDHFIHLVPQLKDRGLLYGETAQWDGTLTNGIPNVLDSGDGCHFSFYGYMAIGKIIWEYVLKRIQKAEASDGAIGDSVGDWLYKLPAPVTFGDNSSAINTGFQPFAYGKDTWTVAVKYKDGLQAKDSTQWGTLLFNEVVSGTTQLKVAITSASQSYPNSSIMINTGGTAFNPSDASQNITKLYENGYHTLIISKNINNYTIYLDNNKVYNNSLSYAQSTNGNQPLYLGGWNSGWGMIKGTVYDLRIYNDCLTDSQVTALNELFKE